MKKILIGVLIVIGISLMFLVSFTDLTRNKRPYLLQTENDVIGYLTKTYENERFEIIRWEYQNKYTNARTWYVKSLDTNIEFKIYDEELCSDMFGCSADEVNYIVKDNYKIMQMQNNS